MKFRITAAAFLFATTLLGAEVSAPASVVDTDGPQFLVPIAGDVIGALGEHFQTDLTLVNFSEDEQLVEVVWIPRQGTGDPISRTLLIDERSYVSHNSLVGGFIDTTGLGSVLVRAVDASGNFDPEGRIHGFARIHNDLECVQTGTASQTILTMELEGWRNGSRAYVHGVRQQSRYRTNYGIVNLDPVNSLRFNVVMTGLGNLVEEEIVVGPMSMVHEAVPAELEGDLSIVFEPLDANGSWRAYASTVDNRTGSGWTVPAMQPGVDLIFED